MKILEKEIDLREETRTTEQAREGMPVEKFTESANSLADTQDEIADRASDVVQTIQELEDAHLFGREIQLLTRVNEVMEEASLILSRPDTGPEAIAAETEAIELLLQAKRINPKGGGGGGSSPGGGGGGTTEESALALVGDGSERDAGIEHRETGEATGVSGRSLPAEFRRGLDQFFNLVEEKNNQTGGAE